MDNLIFYVCIIPIILTLSNLKIARILNLFDAPDSFRKFHDEKTPLTGGIIIFLTFLTFIFFDYLNFKIFGKEIYINQNENFSLIFGSFIFFLIGLIDDKKNLSPNTKIILFIFFLKTLIFFDQNLNIRIISLSILKFEFSIGLFSYFWTIICFLLFINAFNMFDGINLQVGTFSLISLLYLIVFHNFLESLLITIIFSILCFLILNFFSKSFLGNSGTYFLGYLISYLFIKTYNIEQNIYADEIVLLMIIPGLDLIRLFFIRIINKKHPFSADRNHIHHYILQKFNKTETFLIISLIIWIPFLIAKFTGYFFFVLVFQFILYSIIIYKFKN